MVWKHRAATIRSLTLRPPPFEVAVPGIGGPMVTAGGVAFLSADDDLRGYDLTTGTPIWRARLPAGARSAPITYAVDGRQFVAIVAGGPGATVTAYALPR